MRLQLRFYILAKRLWNKRSWKCTGMHRKSYNLFFLLFFNFKSDCSKHAWINILCSVSIYSTIKVLLHCSWKIGLVCNQIYLTIIKFLLLPFFFNIKLHVLIFLATYFFFFINPSSLLRNLCFNLSLHLFSLTSFRRSGRWRCRQHVSSMWGGNSTRWLPHRQHKQSSQ